MGAVISFLVIAIVVLLILSSCIRIVPQAQALVVERLGAYLETWSVGVHFKVPFIDRVAKRVILKEQVVDFAPQPVITKDNVTMRIDTGCVLPDYGSEAFRLWCRESDHGYREPDRYHP